MVRKGHKTCIATSSGNTGAALAAYSAAAGIQCLIVVVDGAPLPKLKQMQLYGAQLLMIRDFGKSASVTDQVFQALERISSSKGLPLPISAYKFCPVGMEGVEGISHEICDALGEMAEIFVPAGGGGLTLAVAKGVLAKGGNGKVHCVQPVGNDTIASALRNKEKARAVPRSTTQVSGLQVANVLDGQEVIDACRALNGNGYIVEDKEVFKWHKALATQEGIFAEPAGAVALAGLAKAVSLQEVDPQTPCVCLVTGSGFKDMPSVDREFALPPVAITDMEDALLLLKELKV
jgi:threonine synthase